MVRTLELWVMGGGSNFSGAIWDLVGLDAVFWGGWLVAFRWDIPLRYRCDELMLGKG